MSFGDLLLLLLLLLLRQCCDLDDVMRVFWDLLVLLVLLVLLLKVPIAGDGWDVSAGVGALPGGGLEQRLSRAYDLLHEQARNAEQSSSSKHRGGD